MPTISEGTLVSDRTPPPHAEYVVRRDDHLFTATPCYGMHSPWWVVKTLDHEAPPVDMNGCDRWWPVKEGLSVFSSP